jgi:hypothetical protein
MSAITNVNTSSSLVYLASQAGSTDSTDDSTAGGSISTPVNGNQQTGSTGSAATSPLADLRGQIETSVTKAVSQLPAGSSPQDILDAVRSAVEDTLKANGLDPQQVRGLGGGHHHHHAHGAGAAASATDPDGDADQQNTTDPLLASLGSSPEKPAPTQPALGAATPSSSSTNLLALIASGPGSTNALSSLLEQLSGGASAGGGQSGTSGNPSSRASSLLTALQNNTASGLDLTGVFKQLFQGFPNGTALDVQA